MSETNREEELRQYLRDRGAVIGAGRHAAKSTEAFTEVERTGEAELAKAKAHSGKVPVSHVERWELLRHQVGWWLNWGMVETGQNIESVAVGPSGVRVQSFTPDTRVWLITWAEQCHKACETARIAVPAESRPTRALLLSIFGVYSRRLAREAFHSSPQPKRTEVLKLLEGMGEPSRPEMGGMGHYEEAQSIAAQVSAEIDAKFAGKLLSSREYVG